MSPIIVRYEGRLIDEEIEGERFLWRVYRPFILHWQQETRQGQIEIVANFVTDFASVPRLFWSILSPVDGCLRKAAVAHDMLYATWVHSRRFSDDLLFYAMLPLGAKAWQRWLVWLAVRIAGRRAYKNGPAHHIENVAAVDFLSLPPLGTITAIDECVGEFTFHPGRSIPGSWQKPDGQYQAPPMTPSPSPLGWMTELVSRLPAHILMSGLFVYFIISVIPDRETWYWAQIERIRTDDKLARQELEQRQIAELRVLQKDCHDMIKNDYALSEHNQQLIEENHTAIQTNNKLLLALQRTVTMYLTCSPTPTGKE